MSRKQDNAGKLNWKELMSEEADFLKPPMRDVCAGTEARDGSGRGVKYLVPESLRKAF